MKLIFKSGVAMLILSVIFQNAVLAEKKKPEEPAEEIYVEFITKHKPITIGGKEVKYYFLKEKVVLKISKPKNGAIHKDDDANSIEFDVDLHDGSNKGTAVKPGKVTVWVTVKKGNIDVEPEGQAADTAIVIPGVELRSNTDNHITFTDKFGDKWPTQSPFESSPAERKYQKEGKALLIAVNDDYTEKQKKSEKWVKDNIASDNGHKIVDRDKSLQDGKIIFPVDLEGDKITLTHSEKIKVWWKIPEATEWTEIPKEDTTEFKKFPNGEVPIKIEGISPGTGTIKLSFVMGETTVTDSLNFKVIKTCRFAYIVGASQHYSTDEIDTDLYNNKVAPSGRFHVVHEEINSVDEVNQYADNFLIQDGEEMPDYWNRVLFITDGTNPHANSPYDWYLRRDSDFLYQHYYQSYLFGSHHKTKIRFGAQIVQQFKERFNRQKEPYGVLGTNVTIKNTNYETNIQTLDKGWSLVQSKLVCGDGNHGTWKNLHSPKVEFFLFSCYNHWAWEDPEKKKKSPNLKRIFMDTTKTVANVFTLQNKEKYIPFESGGEVYGKIGQGSISEQKGGVLTDYAHPIIVRKYLKKN